MAPDQSQQAGGAPGVKGARARIEQFVDIVGEWTSWISLVIVVLMATNVLLRYAFSVGTVWAQELE